MTRRCATASIVAIVAALVAPAANAAVGDLDRLACITGSTAITACTASDAATATGEDSGMSSLSDVEASPDGRSVYALGVNDDAITHFRRDQQSGALTYVVCITGETQSTPGCSQGLGGTSMGTDSGFDRPDGLAISPDGLSVYVIAGFDQTVAHFSRDTQTGDLTQQGCLTGDSNVTACTPIPGAVAGGTDTALQLPSTVDVSPDGASVYVGSLDGTIAHFARSGPLGALAYAGCLSADSNTDCTKIPGHSANAANTGLESLRFTVVSPDGLSLYAVSDSDAAVSEFALADGDGTPSFRRCLTGATDITNCTAIPGATPNGNDTGLRSIVHLTVSPDGNSVYTSADSDNALARFDRAPSGALTFAGCFVGYTGSGQCTSIPGSVAGGADSGLTYPAWAEVAPDGHSVYVAAPTDDSVATFDRNPRTGALAFHGCLSGRTETAANCGQIQGAASTGAGSGLDAVGALALSPDGRSLYTAASGDHALTTFDREPDVTAPASRITSGPAEGALINVTAASFGFDSPSDDLVGFACRADGGGFADCASPFEMTGLADGPHTFSVRAVDIGGNIEDPAALRNFTVDTRAPRLRIVGKKLRLNRKGAGKLRLRCPANEISGPCRGTLTLRTRKRKRIVLVRARRFSVASGKTKRVKARLSKRNRRLLRKRPSARKARVIAKVRDRADNRRTVAKNLQVKPGRR